MLDENKSNLIDALIRLEHTKDYSTIYDEIDQLVSAIMNASFINPHPDFLSNNYIYKYFSNNYDQQKKLWYLINEYLVLLTDPAAKEIKLTEIKNFLENILHRIQDDSIINNVQHLLEAEFIRKLYLINDESLIQLFLRYLPHPKLSMFHLDDNIPKVILDMEENANRSIKKILEDNNNDVTAIEGKIVKIQRLFRAKRRQKEAFQNAIKNNEFTLWLNPKQLLVDANKPYAPKKCDPALSKRLMKCAEKVTPFKTVKHICSEKYLKNILDEGLLGQRTLLQFYLPFIPATLNFVDIKEGDGNVVCCGANKIDPLAYGGGDKVEIEFDLKKLTRNPCTFYKQLDLGYHRAQSCKIPLGNSELIFKELQGGGNHSTKMIIGLQKAAQACIEGFAHIPNLLLISYNLSDMQKILTLNFFRFLDELYAFSGSNTLIKAVYEEINNLNETELLSFLNQLQSYMTDTMEFNFYGAYKIDFNALLSISKLVDPTHDRHGDKFYSLNLPSFIDDLNNGNDKTLEIAQNNLPSLFNSYRFIAYLLEKVQYPDIRLRLKQHGENCRLPNWLSFQSFNANVNANKNPDRANGNLAQVPAKTLQRNYS